MMAQLAEGFNMCKRSKQKIYEDNSLVYKITLLKKIPSPTKNLACVQIRMG